jgi:hypothetical protein
MWIVYYCTNSDICAIACLCPKLKRLNIGKCMVGNSAIREIELKYLCLESYIGISRKVNRKACCPIQKMIQ